MAQKSVQKAPFVTLLLVTRFRLMTCQFQGSIFSLLPPPLGGWKKIWAVEENMAGKVSECQNYRFLTQEIIYVSLQKPHLSIKTSLHSQITVCRLVSTCIHHHIRMWREPNVHSWREPNVHSSDFRCIIRRKFPQLVLSTACFTKFPQLIFPHTLS